MEPIDVPVIIGTEWLVHQEIDKGRLLPFICSLVFSCPTSCRISPDFRNVFLRPENALNLHSSVVSSLPCPEPLLRRCTQVHKLWTTPGHSSVQSMPCCVGQGFPQYRCLTPAKRRAAPRVDEPVTSACQSCYNML